MNFGKINKIIFLGNSELIKPIISNIESAVETEIFNKIPSFLPNIDKKMIGISISYRHILKNSEIKKFNGRLINLHGTLLPSNRGGGGQSWRVMRGLEMPGYTIHLLTSKLDAGDILKQESTEENNLKQKMIDGTSDFLKSVLKGKDFKLITQDESKSTYWPRLNTKIHGFIDWSWSTNEIINFIKAFSEYGGASTFINKKLIRIKKAHLVLDQKYFHPFQYGIIIRKNKGVIIATKNGELLIENIQNVLIGDRFYTPNRFLEKAYLTRIFYK